MIQETRTIWNAIILAGRGEITTTLQAVSEVVEGVNKIEGALVCQKFSNFSNSHPIFFSHRGDATHEDAEGLIPPMSTVTMYFNDWRDLPNFVSGHTVEMGVVIIQ
jgi:hypothetical protein